jgi:hypothetical protein
MPRVAGAGSAGDRGRAPRRPRRAWVFALAALAVALAGCASDAPTWKIAPGHEGAAGVERFLLAPANLVVSLRAELEGGVELVQEEISGYLQQQGRRVERLSLPEGRRLWDAAVSENRSAGTPGFEGTMALFVRELARTREFQALVMPSLLLHHTRVRMRQASWDGVQRRIALANLPAPKPGQRDLMRQGMAGIGISGEAAVTSLHLFVFSREGERVFEGRGGLEFVEEIDVGDVLERGRIFMRTRADLLQDRAVLREGIAIAFSPYLPPPRER